MTVFYKPRKLREAKEYVATIHSSKGKAVVVEEDEDFLRLLFIVVGMAPQKLSKFGARLEDRDFTKLASYVVTNKRGVNCNNIYLLLEEYASKMDFASVFYNWQNHYTNQEVQSFLSKNVNNPAFQAFLQDSAIDTFRIVWIKETDPVRTLEKLCSNNDTLETYQLELALHGVIKDTLLYIKCLDSFILVCSEKAYLEFGDASIAEMYLKLDNYDRIQFICNFVKVVSISNLDRMRQVHDVIMKTIDSDKFKNDLFQELTKQELKEKFDLWGNRIRLRDAIEDRYRYIFWVKYLGGNVVLHDEDEYTMYMDFGNYVVTEFKGKAAGPAYIIEKEYFQKKVRHEMIQLGKNAFQQYLFNDFSYKSSTGIKERMAHSGGESSWFVNFIWTLRRYGIVQST